MLSDHLSGIDVFSRLHEEAAPVEQLVHGVCYGLACLQGDERAVVAALYFTLERLVLLEAVRHYGFSLACCQQVGTKPHEASGRNLKFEQGAVSARLHVYERSLAAGRNLDGRSHELLRHLDGKFLDRLASLASDCLVEHFRLADLKLETLAAHGLDEH